MRPNIQDSRCLPCVSLTLALVLAAAPVASQTAAPAPKPVLVDPQGKWGTPCQHVVTPGTFPQKECPVGPLFNQSSFLNPPSPQKNDRIFKALHLALIPQPEANAGLVIGYDSQDQSGNWSQRWTILDPSTDPPTVLWNDELVIQGAGTGNLFCSGHAWTPDGRLFVAGGTTKYGRPFGGATLLLMFDPADPAKPYGDWTILSTELATNRWYPTVTLQADGKMMVSGGTHDQNAKNNYELFDPLAMAASPLYQGPSGSASFGNYPRLHVLSDGWVFVSSPKTSTAKVDAVNNPGGAWTAMASSSVFRHDGASILFPRNFGNEDEVWILGGSQGQFHATVHETVESILPKQSSATWQGEASMTRPRVHLNAVLLPDKTVLVIGGNTVDENGNKIFWKDAEWYSQGTWYRLVAGDSVRDYHSTAVLLPDGNVLSAGGDARDWDYQLFSPPYFDNDLARPTNVTLSSHQLGYLANGAGPYSATYSPGDLKLRRVVLLPAGSTTHHSDMGQRLVDLELLDEAVGSVQFNPPYNQCASPNPTHSCAPPGYYMLFLVADNGTPSVGQFVHVQ